MRSAWPILASSALFLLCASAAHSEGAGAPLQDGVYTCISSSGSFMLTLGEATIEGNNYRFHPPTGPDTMGTYSYVPGQITWSGDFGIVTNAQITESDLDQGSDTDDFWFKFNFDATHVNTVNCKL